MLRLFAIVILLAGLSVPAHADIWKWVDDQGRVHFVESDRPIYTWKDVWGKIHYSDTPDHEDAVSVELIWVSEGSLEELDEDIKSGESGGYAFPGETAEERAEREAAEAYYCKRATEIVNSYQNAPSLYKTNDAGERVILSEEEAAATIADAVEKRKGYCRE